LACTRARAEPLLQPDGEEDVGRFRLTVGEPLLIRPLLELDVVEDHRRHVMAARADRDDAARRAAQQRRRQQTGEEKVAEVIRAELHLEAVARLGEGTSHDTGVVDQHVEPRMARQEALGEGTDAGH
jgi:hypothetical protein